MLAWIAGWAMATAAIGVALIAWTLAQGGSIHRTPVCRGPDQNFYALAVQAGAAALVVVVLYWALSAQSVGSRVVRVGAVAVGAVPILFATLFATSAFQAACT